MTVKMITLLNPTSSPETREVPFALAAAYGANAGMYKVQAVCLATDTIIQEWS